MPRSTILTDAYAKLSDGSVVSDGWRCGSSHASKLQPIKDALDAILALTPERRRQLLESLTPDESELLHLAVLWMARDAVELSSPTSLRYGLQALFFEGARGDCGRSVAGLAILQQAARRIGFDFRGLYTRHRTLGNEAIRALCDTHYANEVRGTD